MEKDCGCEEKNWPMNEDESGDDFIKKISNKTIKTELREGIDLKKQSLLNRIRKITASDNLSKEPESGSESGSGEGTSGEESDEENEAEVDITFEFTPEHEKCMPDGCLPEERPPDCSEKMYKDLVNNNYPFCVNSMEKNRLENMKIIDILQKLDQLK